MITEMQKLSPEETQGMISENQPLIMKKNITTPTYYDNSNGSLYQFAEQHNLNSYEFDIIKRIVRCRKKGRFNEDLKKTITVIEIYLQEHHLTK